MRDTNPSIKKRIHNLCVFYIPIISFVIFFSSEVFSQQKLWEDSFNGGVTTGGYSPDYQSGGTGKFEVKIEKNSTIRKAFLLVGRFGVAQPITITMNGKQYVLDKNNMGTTQFQSRSYGGSSAVHVIDVTKDIDATTTEYTIDVPQQTGPSNRFNDFYLYIAYQNKNLKKINTAIYLRNSDLVTSDKFKIDLAVPTRKTTDIGISLFCGYVCHMEGDGEYISLNGEKMGELGGHDSNSGYCGGPIGSFYYKDNVLVGLQDDNADKDVNGSEALINAKTILKDKSTSFEMGFDADNKVYGNHETNAVWGIIIAYGSDVCTMDNVAVSDDQETCKGSSVKLTANGGTKYKWSTGEEISEISVTPDITTKYFVTVSNANCSVIDSVTVKVFDASSANAGNDTTVCGGGSVTLTAKGGNTYAWSTGERTQSIAVNPKIKTTYTVTISSGACTATDNVTVNIFNSAFANAGKDTVVCSGSSVILSAKGGGTYAWSNGEKTQSINVRPRSTTTYIVTVSSGSCSATDDVIVTVKALPGIDAASDVYILPDSSAVINLKGPDGNYKWWPASGLSCTNCKSPTVFPDSTTKYYVTYTTLNGCTAFDSVVVHFRETLAYYVTNPFTPNGDGNNDVFMISLRRGKLLDFTISDKDSKIVFKSTGETYEWSGNYFNGSPAPSGIYIYTLDYTDDDGKHVQKSGAFNLIR